MVTTMTGRENAKLFQTSHWIPNPAVATSLVVVIFFERFSGILNPPNLARSINFRNQAVSLIVGVLSVMAILRQQSQRFAAHFGTLAPKVLGT